MNFFSWKYFLYLRILSVKIEVNTPIWCFDLPWNFSVFSLNSRLSIYIYISDWSTPGYHYCGAQPYKPIFTFFFKSFIPVEVSQVVQFGRSSKREAGANHIGQYGNGLKSWVILLQFFCVYLEIINFSNLFSKIIYYLYFEVFAFLFTMF